MPTFETPGPVAVTVSLAMGDVRVIASDREDTVVDVRPASGSAKSQKMAEQTAVDYRDGRVTIRTPKGLSLMLGRPGGVDVDILVPTGSQLDGETGMGDLMAEGRLGACRFRSGMGTLRLGDTGPLNLSTGMGEVSVVAVDGDAEVTTGSGELRLGRVTGAATVKNSNGGVHVDEVGRVSRLTTSNGDISVGRVSGGVTAKTARGSIRVREARNGDVVLQSAVGEVEIGVPEGTAAWLDLQTPGMVRTSLAEVGGPADTDEQVKIRARTSWGDISVHRSLGRNL